MNRTQTYNSWETLSFSTKAEEKGFVSASIRGTSTEPVKFDDFSIQLKSLYSAKLYQENHYYPFGMNMKGLESQDVQTTQNKEEYRWQYNERNEREKHFGLFWDETKYRTYDIQLGRFNHVDPKAEEADQEGWTPYHYAFNNPIRYNDKNGDTGWDVIKGFLVAVVDNFTGGLVNLRGSTNYTDAADYNRGQDIGDLSSVAGGGSMAVGGGTVAAGGEAAVVVSPFAGPGVGVVAGGGAVVAGVGLAVAGMGTMGAVNGVDNFSNQKGRVYAKGKKRRTRNKLKPADDAQGSHTSFERGNHNQVYKYETYEKTKTGHYNPTKRYDGGQPDGSKGAPHKNKKGQKIETPHVQGKNVDEGIRPALEHEKPKK